MAYRLTFRPDAARCIAKVVINIFSLPVKDSLNRNSKNEPVDYRSNRTFIVNAEYEAVIKRPHSDKDALRYKINTEKMLEDHAPEEFSIRIILSHVYS